ncbi:hypothetical protein BU16DRAFT_377052 [Lophium mytilinum]|uniref:Uncharacterized protein n=1 Tax=Lophium mytilinum TaxID=390894 RepID=A0A6A6QVJ2_9PEZI|nr:hypothetical protein BU16DRAFT_377052 [Lophium mytilinum]
MLASLLLRSLSCNPPISPLPYSPSHRRTLFVHSPAPTTKLSHLRPAPPPPSGQSDSYQSSTVARHIHEPKVPRARTGATAKRRGKLLHAGGGRDAGVGGGIGYMGTQARCRGFGGREVGVCVCRCRSRSGAEDVKGEKGWKAISAWFEVGCYPIEGIRRWIGLYEIFYGTCVFLSVHSIFYFVCAACGFDSTSNSDVHSPHFLSRGMHMFTARTITICMQTWAHTHRQYYVLTTSPAAPISSTLNNPPYLPALAI